MISFVVTGISPDYKCYTYNRQYAKIKSNVRVDVIRLTLVAGSGVIYSDFNGTRPIQKDGEEIFNIYNSNNGNNYESGRVIKVLLKSDVRGTFFRVYSANSMPWDNEWKGPKPMQVAFD